MDGPKRLMLLGLLLLAGTWVAAGPNGTVGEIARMLENGVTEDVIIGWLERQSDPPNDLDPDDLIILTRAGASDELIGMLMQRPSTTPPTATDTEAPTSLPVSLSGEIPVEFSVRYRGYREPETEEDEQWLLFVYVDGRPVVWSDGRNWLDRTLRTVNVERLLSTGPHVLRVIQERHWQEGKKGWHHEARVAPESLEFQPGDGEPGVEIQVTRPVGIGVGKRVQTAAMLDGDQPHGETRELGGSPAEWPPLCDDLESGYDEGDKIPRWVRKELERCLRWDDLWPGLDKVPSRDEVRTELARSNFRP